MRRLPPLNAVRAFEAAARHMSFTRAAEELNVTQAAISHQVKALEDRLGVQLFHRAHRTLNLTRAGTAYLPEVSAALDALAGATEAIAASDEARRLSVSVLPSFAAKWLTPRLGSLWNDLPDLDVRIIAADSLANFDSDEIDVAIRYGQGQWPGLRADLVMREELFPVCSPALLEGPKAIREPADLLRHVLLHDDVMTVDWVGWMRAAGVTVRHRLKGPVFSHSSLVLDAAASGLGVALARSALVADDLAAGRLVRPFLVSVSGADAYYLLCASDRAELRKIAQFRDWLKREAQRFRTVAAE